MYGISEGKIHRHTSELHFKLVYFCLEKYTLDAVAFRKRFCTVKALAEVKVSLPASKRVVIVAHPVQSTSSGNYLTLSRSEFFTHI